MLVSVFLFYLFSMLTVISAVAVIAVKNPVHSVLSLIFAFFNAAGLFVLLGAELLAMLLVIVYVGAVAVLFLFVVMMLNINFARMKEGFLRYLPIGLAAALILFAELFLVLHVSTENLILTPHTVAIEDTEDAATNAEALGNVLYTYYAYLFQLAGLILLVAMIGAIVLTHRQRPGVRKQDIDEQLARDPKTTVKLVKVRPGSGV